MLICMSVVTCSSTNDHVQFTSYMSKTLIGSIDRQIGLFLGGRGANSESGFVPPEMCYTQLNSLYTQKHRTVSIQD